MTAVTTREARPVPRPLLRIFWKLHRAIDRVTRGRLGLQRPVAGEKFGMMRLHDDWPALRPDPGRDHRLLRGRPEPRHPGDERMGQDEPAWWLNLQATPQAVVELADGRRSVSARAATSAERDRLWATFADYPGLGRGPRRARGAPRPPTGDRRARAGWPAAVSRTPTISGPATVIRT